MSIKNEDKVFERVEGELLDQQKQSPAIHYTELPESAPGPIMAEWNLYRREVGRLLAEGHEGRWVLIKGEDIIGIWDTEEAADRVRLQNFQMRPVLLKQICTREKILRGGEYDHRWAG